MLAHICRASRLLNMKVGLLFFCAFLVSLSGRTQSLSTTDIKDLMVKDWERAKLFTIDYLNAMPAEKYSFKAVDSIRSFGAQMLHLAWVNVAIVGLAAGQAPLPWAQPALQSRKSAENKDSVFYYVSQSYDYCINAVKNLDISKWGEKVKYREYEGTRFDFINKMFEHQTHMRGQTAIYIRLQGIRPPQERF